MNKSESKQPCNRYSNSPLYQFRTDRPILTLDEYRSLIASGKVVVFFTASWCGPCKAISPDFYELQNIYGMGIAFVKLDVDENWEIANAEGITSVPTFKFYKNAKKVYQDLCGDNLTLLRNGVTALYQYEFRKIQPQAAALKKQPKIIYPQ